MQRTRLSVLQVGQEHPLEQSHLQPPLEHLPYSTRDMASYFFSEPFYSLNDFDRLFEEAFNTRTGTQPQSQVQRVQDGSNGSRLLRPR